MRKKRIYVWAALAAVSGFAAVPAAAQESPFYIGGKIGAMDADFAGFDNALNVGVTAGYDLLSYRSPGQTGVLNGTLSAEGEITTTVSDGDIAGGGDWDADTLAVYLAYRTAGELYGKVKAGYLDQDIKRAGGAGGAIVGGDDSGFSYGVGAGWRLDSTSGFELEYTSASDDLSFFSVGYVTRF